MKLVSEKHFYKERYLKLNAIGITEKQMIRALNMEFKIVMIAPYVLGALLGYLYIVISSFYTPVFMYFARDLFGFIVIFLVFEWSIYVVSFKRFYKSIIK